MIIISACVCKLILHIHHETCYTCTNQSVEIEIVYLYFCSVTVSVITIKGTTCNLFDLGQVGQITGGQVNVVTFSKI